MVIIFPKVKINPQILTLKLLAAPKLGNRNYFQNIKGEWGQGVVVRNSVPQEKRVV